MLQKKPRSIRTAEERLKKLFFRFWFLRFAIAAVVAVFVFAAVVAAIVPSAVEVVSMIQLFLCYSFLIFFAKVKSLS